MDLARMVYPICYVNYPERICLALIKMSHVAMLLIQEYLK